MKSYIDPYIDRNSGVLKNKCGTTDKNKLYKIESDYTILRLSEIAEKPIVGDFNFKHLCTIHEAIFQDIYEWAGCQRTINIEKPEEALGGLSVQYTECDEIQREASIILSKMRDIPWDKLTLDQKSVEFSQCMADLWKVHPFREGNTRTVVTFCCDFADSRGFGLNRQLFKDNSEFLRRALVAASAKFTDLGDLSQPEHLRKIVKDGMEQGEFKRQKEQDKPEEKQGKETMDGWKKEIAREKEKDKGSIKSGTEKSHSKSSKER